MSKLEEIIEGWKNNITRDNVDVEKLSTARLTICNGCSLNMSGICNPMMGGCGCLLSAKTRSPKSKCPKGKW